MLLLQPFKSELFNNLVVLEARMFKTIASFAAENIAKNGGKLEPTSPAQVLKTTKRLEPGDCRQSC